MPKFMVKKSCYMYIVVEAPDDDAAIEVSWEAPDEAWHVEQSSSEVEPDDVNEVDYAPGGRK